jgi:RND family efflux transporter MFP subunit
VQAKFQNSRIISPISGVINQFDAKVGQLATANAPLVSIIGTGGFEVHAGVSETDIGKLSVGNKVKMTLDAFQNETFVGTIFYIAPAETNTAGVINYQIKVSFDQPDLRVKSGLTANLIISTRKKDAVLILPQYAILQNDDGNFVQVLENTKIKKLPVVLGLQDQDGNVEVVSGVVNGQDVLNVGLKKN